MPVESVSVSAEGIVNDLRLASSCRTPVLISASGPESARTLAYEIHDMSIRSAGPFRAFRARSFPTDADALYRACHELKRLSHWGTLYIDGVEETPVVSLKAAFDELLRLSPVYDVRLICGTAVKLHEYVQNGLFDEACFYRLNALHIDALRMTSHHPES
jgi:transcriptional regulator of aromatic amino acid metabolism